MAPEAIAQAPVGPAADLYAVGCVAFELLTGNTTKRAFDVAGDAIRCGGCGRASRPDAFVASSVIRFEGVSDPDDSAILLAVSCPQCGSRGTIVQAYGPGAGPAGDVVAAVRSAGTR